MQYWWNVDDSDANINDDYCFQSAKLWNIDVSLMTLWGNIDDFDGNIEDHQWFQSTIFQNIDGSLMIHVSLMFASQI